MCKFEHVFWTRSNRPMGREEKMQRVCVLPRLYSGKGPDQCRLLASQGKSCSMGRSELCNQEWQLATRFATGGIAHIARGARPRKSQAKSVAWAASQMAVLSTGVPLKVGITGLRVASPSSFPALGLQLLRFRPFAESKPCVN